jgi:hypothetical protein
MTTAYAIQKFFVGVVILGTAALLAVWTVLLTDLDKLATATPPTDAYRSTRNCVLLATLLLGNIVFLSLLKAVTRTTATCGPLYTGLVASQGLLSAAFVHVSFMDAWISNATYEPYYSNLSINLLSGLRLQLACLVLSWTTAGFVCALCFERHFAPDSNNYDTAAERYALRGRGAAGDFFTEEDGFSGQPGVPGVALRRRCRSPGASMRATAHSYGPMTVDASPPAATADELYHETPRDAPQFYVPAGPVFAPARRV